MVEKPERKLPYAAAWGRGGTATDHTCPDLLGQGSGGGTTLHTSNTLLPFLPPADPSITCNINMYFKKSGDTLDLKNTLIKTNSG